ncbi:hypothetical protein, partial [Micromonospora luteifusca]|uniref:hypothetical protein n=1 Tax=Micromonospora luteifusca TaxID=709860 RepID=UPI0033B01F98
MTAGFGSGDGRPAGAEPDDSGGPTADRPGPLPPRVEPYPGPARSNAKAGADGKLTLTVAPLSAVVYRAG